MKWLWKMYSKYDSMEEPYRFFSFIFVMIVLILMVELSSNTWIILSGMSIMMAMVFTRIMWLRSK